MLAVYMRHLCIINLNLDIPNDVKQVSKLQDKQIVYCSYITRIFIRGYTQFDCTLKLDLLEK